jgi:hypothetical protein
MLRPTSTTSCVLRGIGRSWRPNTRLASEPTIDPTAMPIIAGPIMRPMPDNIWTNGSLLGSTSGLVLT